MYFVGIDISKYKHDCFICTETGEVIEENLSFTNTNEGFNQLLNLLKSLDNNQEIRIGFEATGHYGMNLKLFLEKNNYSFMEFNPALVKRFISTQTLRRTKTDKKDADTVEVTPTPKPTETPKPTPSATPEPTSTPEPTPEAEEKPATPVHQILYESDSPELHKWIYNYECDWDGAKDFFSSHYGDTIKFEGNVLDAYSEDGTYYTLAISAGDYGNTSATVAFVAKDIYAQDDDGITDGYNPPFLTKKNYYITAKVGSFDESAGRCFIELKTLESR